MVLTIKSRNDMELYKDACAIRLTFLQLWKSVQDIDSSTAKVTIVKLVIVPSSIFLALYPVPSTKSTLVGLQVYSHQSFFRLRPHMGTSSPKTESICLKFSVIIAT